MLVLATLGVYIGLVLVGAAPQVLANAAMTRQFNVKDEIEFNDELDNQPDNERSPVSTSVQVYLEDVEYFLAGLARLNARGSFDLAKDTFDVAQTTMLPCVDGNMAGRYTPIRFDSSSEKSRSALEYFSRGMTYGYSLGDCLVNGEFSGVTAVDSRFNFKLDDNDFLVNVAVKKGSPQSAIEMQRLLESTLKRFAAADTVSLRQKIVENTSFQVQNDQVFIVTRLPRAGLETLLGKSAK